MHKIALEPKEPYKLWADGKWCGRATAFSKDAGRVLGHFPPPVLSTESAEGRTGVVKDILFPCGVGG
jgi:hypothetical protein